MEHSLSVLLLSEFRENLMRAHGYVQGGANGENMEAAAAFGYVCWI